MVFKEGDVLEFDVAFKADRKVIQFEKGTTVDRSSPLIDAPKGLRYVLQERGFSVKGLPRNCNRKRQASWKDDDDVELPFDSAKPCCMLCQLADCEDFRTEKPTLQNLIESLGHKCIFFPKFHPELNFIERFWSHVKRELRKTCEYTLNGFDKHVTDKLHNACKLATIRRYARHSWRWMSTYSLGLPPKVVAYAVKKFRGHRTIPPGVDGEIMRCYTESTLCKGNSSRTLDNGSITEFVN
mmetsp:Transcript_20475/g.65357  ORF Transcript_20475/g.65357 Transcript_20475/m.65357 type:complete len:240 (+) Transcript_20475:666-1385(+)